MCYTRFAILSKTHKQKEKETYYGYIKETNVKIGQIVDKGRVIGRCSNKGVYFQIVYMGIEKNPLELINLDNEKKLL